MKIKITLVIYFLIFISFVSADILSINSGGDNGLIINPQELIEGFFFQSNHLPVVTNVILSSSSGNNYTMDNLSVSYSSSDADGDEITNITDWRVNGNSVNVLNMPFDTRHLNGKVRDYSTYENNGTLGGGTTSAIPVWTENCKIGGCYSFDGVDDEISVSGSYDLHTKFSYAFWVKYQGNSSYDWPYLVGSSNTHKYYGVRKASPSGTGDVYLEWGLDPCDGSSYTSKHISSSYFSDKNWHQVVFTFDGSQVVSYLDGSVYGSPTSTSMCSGSFSDMVIGKYFNGSIDEVKVYDRALSPEQISVLYNSGLENHSVEKYVSQETDKGDVWQVAVTPNDKTADGATVLSNTLTIENAVPEDPSPNLVSVDGTNESDADLNCSTFISDKDNSDLDVYVKWIKNNVTQLSYTFNSQQNGTLFSTILDSSNLTLGDEWKCSVRVGDGSDYSNWVNSSALKIIDITPPIIVVISPNSSINYTTLDVDFNVSLIENEQGYWCGYSLDGDPNVTMNQLNDSYYWYEPSLGPGPHTVVYTCNDTSGNYNSTSVDFNILNEAAIAIQLSDNLSWSIKWNIVTLPISYLDAEGNNGNGSTLYYVNISATNTLVDLYVKADGDLYNDAMDVLGLGNETYSHSSNDSTVSNVSKKVMSTDYALIGEGLEDNSTVYLKFYLNAPMGQPAGTYTNNLQFKAVRNGETP